MLYAVTWYLLTAIIGLVTFPLVFRLLPGLPDRGYTIARSAGLLLTGYIFWLLTSLGFTRNTEGGILLALLIVGSISLWTYLADRDDQATLGTWLSQHTRLLVAAESVFAIAYIAWLIVRAHNPEIVGTEKPMELAFLNGVRMSERFPPHDPWLSGYAISYYYFGYVLMAMLADLTATPSGLAFNLSISLLFALTVLGSYGLVLNLISHRLAHEVEPNDETVWLNSTQATPSSLVPKRTSPYLFALLGPLLTTLIGNLTGFLDVIRAANLRLVPPSFWRWLDIEEISEPLTQAIWPPQDVRYLWWWRASRIIHDRNPVGESSGLQPINEFPFFSFLLGDLHPHVLALPFTLLMLGLTFNLLCQQKSLDGRQFVFYGLCMGGLAFLNAWDLPIYLFILLLAMVAYQVKREGIESLFGLSGPLVTIVGFFLFGLLAYLPWYVSFTSQAGGVLPNLLFPTRFQQMFVMFGPFLLIIAWYLAEMILLRTFKPNWVVGLGGSALLLTILIVVMLVLGSLVVRRDPGALAFFLTSTGLDTVGMTLDAMFTALPQATDAALRYRLSQPVTPLVLTLLIGITLALLIGRIEASISTWAADSETSDAGFDASSIFVLVLILTGALLIIGPEFLYLRDNFGQRLNTIFKFYYAAWMLFAVASAYIAYTLTTQPNWLGGLAFVTLFVVVVAAGLAYTAIALPAKTGDLFSNRGSYPLTLDGLAYFERSAPAEYEAIVWLSRNAKPDAIVLEAVGGAYSGYGRVSSITGLQTVLGWANHERQWRGDLYAELAGTRETDVPLVYRSASFAQAHEIAIRYRVSYIFVGSLERAPDNSTPIGLEKLGRFYTTVFQKDGVVIYQVGPIPITQDLP